MPTPRHRIFVTLYPLIALAAAGCGGITLQDPDVIYIAFGDSATAGPAERDYPEILAGQLGVSSNTLANEGVGGEITADGLARLRGLLASEVFPNAEVLLYWQGGTDLIDVIQELDPLLLWAVSDADYPFDHELDAALDAIQENVAYAIRSGRSAGLDVYVATYYPLREDFMACPALLFELIVPGQAQRANEYNDLLNERIRLAAFLEGAVLVDVAAEGERIADSADNYENCNHLSASGNAIVAEVFQQNITARRSKQDADCVSRAGRP